MQGPLPVQGFGHVTSGAGQDGGGTLNRMQAEQRGQPGWQPTLGSSGCRAGDTAAWRPLLALVPDPSL